MAKTHVEHIEIVCSNPVDCPRAGAPFLQLRNTQRFCSTACKRSWHLHEKRVAPHACPYCTTVHDPEEKSVVDALELWLHDFDDRNGTWMDGYPEIEAFIARRRAILRGETVPAVADVLASV